MRSLWGARLAMVLLAALAWRVVLLVHGWRLGEFAAEALATLGGRSYSPAFANRILGPLLLRATMAVTGLGPDRALAALALALLALANLVGFESLRRRTGDRGVAFRATALSCAAFVLLTDADWIKVWDFSEYLIFVLFAHCILAGAALHSFVALFSVDVPEDPVVWGACFGHALEWRR